ncbi:MAG: HRDC domain-containing protein [Baekduia sp.]
MDDFVRELADRARAAGRLGLDTEFVGEGRYQPLLCLVQIALPDGEIVLLDPIAEPFDPAPLADVLGDSDIEVVLHAARQDVALIRRDWGTPVRCVFDTQIAAGFAGLRAQMGYDALLKATVRKQVHKGASFTRWDRRPLTEEQLSYARGDVEHLLAVADELQSRLLAAGRLEWAREECRYLEEIDDGREIDALFAKLPKIGTLDPVQRAIARELVVWREDTAQQADRPPSTVLMDATLVEIAKRRPNTTEKLSHIRGVGEATLHRRGRSLMEAIERGAASDPIPAEPVPKQDQGNVDAPVIALTEAFVRTRARAAGLAYELLATRSELQRIAGWAVNGAKGTEPDVRALHGWRRELVGEELLELLEGNRSLRVGSGGRLLIER